MAFDALLALVDLGLAVLADQAELKQACNRLASSGYPIRRDVRFSELATQRSQYCAYIDALATHLGKPGAVLVRQG